MMDLGIRISSNSSTGGGRLSPSQMMWNLWRTCWANFNALS